MLYKLLLTALAMPLIANAACKTENDRSIERDTRVIRQEVVLKKKFQRVIRYDCNLDPITDKTEIVDPPAEMISIQSEGHFTMNEVGHLAYNRTTCEDIGFANIFAGGLTSIVLAPLSPIIRAQMNFKVNSESDIYMHVKKDQENFIDFSFTKCISGSNKTDSSSSCRILQTLEKGVLILNVKYDEVMLPEVKEIFKAEKDCSGVSAKEEKSRTKWARWGNYLFSSKVEPKKQ